MFEITNVTLAQQIDQAIAEAICTGTLTAGERLHEERSSAPAALPSERPCISWKMKASSNAVYVEVSS